MTTNRFSYDDLPKVEVPSELREKFAAVPRGKLVRVPKAAIDHLFSSLTHAEHASALTTVAVSLIVHQMNGNQEALDEIARFHRTAVNNLAAFYAIIAADTVEEQLPEEFIEQVQRAADGKVW